MNIYVYLCTYVWNTLPNFEDVFPIQGDEAKHLYFSTPLFFQPSQATWGTSTPQKPWRDAKKAKATRWKSLGRSCPGFQKSIKLDEQGSA